MSNMQQYGAAKNPPWARGGTQGMGGQGMTGMQAQMLGQGVPGMVQYQQPQAFQPLLQQQIGMAQLQSNQSPMFPQSGVVSYPAPRVLNPAFAQQQQQNQSSQGASGQTPKVRVFTGTVTKAHNDFGFVDEDVFFQTDACVKGSYPAVGDRVLVEASFNHNMPFKWNATRIQVLPSANKQQQQQQQPRRDNQAPTKNKQFGGNDQGGGSGGGGYNAVPPPGDSQNGGYSPRNARPARKMPMRPERSRPRDSRQSEESDRKRTRKDRDKERAPEKVEDKEKARSPQRRSSKPRRRPRPVARYLVQIPKIALDIPEADVLEIRRRYSNLYIPSDFFNTQFRWIDAFPPNVPFTMNKPCSFHVIHKDVDSPVKNDAVLEPPDVDYSFSAKVMLLSMPTLEEVYRKCCAMSGEEKEKKEKESEERDFIHPTRLINFLVGLRGKNETMAIGGPWSPSLDGPNPEGDPSVLIKTAIRTCKAHTGIDLASCTQWYRFVELYYRRAESCHRGKAVPARVETVVIFVPDVWSCLPTRLEWDSLEQLYRARGERPPTPPGPQADQVEKIDLTETDKKTPTHFSELDPKTMNVGDLRKELYARNIQAKGLKSQLAARLTKAMKSEEAKQAGAEEMEVADEVESEPEAQAEDQAAEEAKKKEDEEKIKQAERDAALWKTRHQLPAGPQLLVHPSRTAKSGKFDCTVMTLSLLLDYRPEDSKEHSFEVSLFAELFNEMLMRDFGFNIYKALYILPDKPKEEKDEKKKEDKKDGDRKSDSKERKAEDEKKDSDSRKYDVKKDDKNKRDERKEGSEAADDDGEDRSSGDRKDKSSDRKDRRRLVTVNPHLLLSFVYFDTSHCGYIFEKDIEELLYTLGLNLSRAQVRRLVAKVVNRDSFHYRHLTDKPKDEDSDKPDEENGTEKEEEEVDAITEMSPSDLSELAAGNKKLLPVFREGEPQSDTSEPPHKRAKNNSEEQGLVSYKGGLLDIGKLMQQLKRSEQARLATEQRLGGLQGEHAQLLGAQLSSTAAAAALTRDLEEHKKRLTEAQAQLHRMQMSSKIFHTALKEIDTKVMSVIHTNLYDDPDAVKTVKPEGTSSRWSTDDVIKKESTEEVKMECSPLPQEDIKIDESTDTKVAN